MGHPRRIAVVTGSRAEYGLLYWLLRDIQESPDLELQIVATGMHLAPQFGMTVDRIVSDGFPVTERVEMLLASDTAGGVAKSMSLGLAGMSDALERLKPDLIVVLGDRFEIMVAVQAAMVQGVPIVHIAGGDVTEGAFDEAIRHAISKMSHIHLATNEQSARRLRQMGEEAWRVHMVGSPGLDHLRRSRLLSREALEESLGAQLGDRNALVTFHPVTLDEDHGVAQVGALLDALADLQGMTIWITRPNADPGGSGITRQIDAWADGRDRVRVYTSLGQERYLSLMSMVDVVVGNSSSGLYEAPSFGVPTVDIGDRQGGRLAADSVVRCEPTREAIGAAVRAAVQMDCSCVVNPYGDGRTAGRIVKILMTAPDRRTLLHKRFIELGEVSA